MDKKTYLSMLAALATASGIVFFALLAAPVVKPLAWALIIGIATMPHHNRLLARFPGHPSRSAGLMVLAVTVCFILPTAALVVTATTNAADWYQQLQQFAASIAKSGSGSLSQIPLIGKAASLGEKYGVDLAGMGAKIAAGASSFILNAATEAARNLLDLLFTLALALFMLFFVYRDGERVVSACIFRFTTDHQKANRYLSEIRSITTAVTVGTIFTCAIQGVTAGVGYYFADVPAPVFCGALTAVAALVPVVGTGVVWLPLAVMVAFKGSILAAGLLALWCIVFVGLADNAIRPLAIGAANDIPVLAIVLGAICGVVTMGLLGLILGPVLFAVLMNISGEMLAGTEPE